MQSRERLIALCFQEYPGLDRTLVDLCISYHERCESRHGKNYKPEKLMSKMRPVSLPKPLVVVGDNPEPRILEVDCQALGARSADCQAGEIASVSE